MIQFLDSRAKRISSEFISFWRLCFWLSFRIDNLLMPFDVLLSWRHLTCMIFEKDSRGGKVIWELIASNKKRFFWYTFDFHSTSTQCLKSLKMSYFKSGIFTILCHFQIDISGNTVWPKVLVLVRNVEWDFFCDFKHRAIVSWRPLKKGPIQCSATLKIQSPKALAEFSIRVKRESTCC